MATDSASLQYADLEITFAPQSANDALFLVGLRLDIPEDDAPPDLLVGKTPHAAFDILKLADQRKDPTAYGKALGEMLFADRDFLEAFRSACRLLHDRGFGTRLRLHLPATAPRLHLLRWETLRVPDRDDFLAHSDQIVLSRYLESSETYNPKRNRAAKATALVVAANALNGGEYHLARIDVVQEVERARKALGENFHVTTLSENVAVTLKAIEKNLAGVDVLYLICHGVLEANHPILCLENEERLHIEVAGEEFARLLKQLNHPPCLVVLASCDSAGTGEVAGNEALAALGPLLISAGVPAVVAMQGKIKLKTVDLLMTDFLAELNRHGTIDLALATARRRVQTQPDWWSPVLYMRSRSGQLFSQPHGGRRRARPSGGERQDVDGLVKRFISNLSHMRNDAVRRQFLVLQAYQGANPGLISASQWRQIETWNAMANEQHFDDWLRFDQVLNVDPLATGGALLMRPDSLRTSGAYYKMVQAVLGHHSDGLKQRKAGSGQRSTLREEQTTTLRNWFVKAKEQRSRFTQLLTAYGLAPSHLEVGCYAAGNQTRSHVFASMVCHGNPFKLAHETEEEFGGLRNGPMFWPDHPCTDRLKAAARPTIVYGATGAGKTALMHYLCRTRMAAVSPADQEMCIDLPSLFDEQTILIEIAQKVSNLMVARILRLTADERLRKTLLTFLVEKLNVFHVLNELHKGPDFSSWQRLYAANIPSDVKRWAEAYYAPVAKDVAALESCTPHAINNWFIELNNLAQALGMRRCHLLIDNVKINDWREQSAMLELLNACKIGLTLFTDDAACADEIEAIGFVRRTLDWDRKQLLDATYHRVDTLCIWLKDKCIEIHRGADWRPDQFLQAFFHADAWEVLLRNSKSVPRTIFDVLNYVVENPTDHSPKVTRGQIEVALDYLHANAPGAQLQY